MNYSPLIYAHGEKNIAVTGKGTLDGQASAQGTGGRKGPWGGTVGLRVEAGHAGSAPSTWSSSTWPKQSVPVKDRVFGDGSMLRPPFIQPYACENVLIEGVRVRNSPFWNIHPVLCKNIILRGVDVFGHGPNNDGVDPESVDHMLIEDMHAKVPTVVVAAAILAVSVIPAQRLGSEFMPTLNEGTLLYMPTTLPGLSVTKAAELLQTQNKIIKSFPEVASVWGKAGRAKPQPTPPRSRCSRPRSC